MQYTAWDPVVCYKDGCNAACVLGSLDVQWKGLLVF
jgi:hypothetical protein